MFFLDNEAIIDNENLSFLMVFNFNFLKFTVLLRISFSFFRGIIVKN